MAGYTRNDTGNNIADGNVINAADLDGEFDSIQTAFNETSGHTHDGTVGEGAPISVVGPAQDINVTITEVAPKTTNTMSLGTAALQFKDLYIDGTANIDSLVADTADINAGTIDGTTIGASTPAAITGTSITATGNIAVTGTVDGRDVATDGTKLDTIETNADVTDTANVTAAGALMDSELTNITAVKALDQGVATTDSPSFAGLTATTADINGGTIDGATIATSDITVGAGKTLDVSAGTLTLADDQISGDKIQGGTIGSITITTLTGTTGNITNVNATTVDATNIEVTNIKAKDGTASATIADATGVMTVASSVLTTTDINGGTIDGVTIGGASAGAGTFTSVTGTSLDMNGSADFSGNINLSQASNTTIKRSDNTGFLSIQGGTDALSTSLVMYGNAHATLPNWTILEADTMVFRTVDNTDFMRFIDGTGTIFNETGADLDFRIESDTNTHAFLLRGSDGYVGIGTGSPAEKLEVTGNIILDATDANIKIKSGAAGTAGAVNFTFNTDSTVYGSLSLPYDTRSSVGLLAQSANAYPMSIASGTSSSATNAVILSTSGEEAMRVDYLGRVGIGTSAPSSLLEIASNATSQTLPEIPTLRITNTDTTVTANDIAGSVEFFSKDASDPDAVTGFVRNIAQDAGVGFNLAFGTKAATIGSDATERMRITSSGNVGIGDSAPPTILSVRGDTPESRITNTNTISDTIGTEEVARLGVYGQKNSVYGPAANIVFRQDASTWSFVDQYNKGTRIEFCTQDATATDTSETPRMVIDKDGNVGIGTASPATTLDVNGGITGTSLNMNGAAVFNESGADVDFRIESDTNANAFFLQGSDGKIGIGTGSPLQPLHVNSSGNTQLLVSSSFNNSTNTGLTIDTVGDSSVFKISATKSGVGRGTLSFLHSSTAALETWNLTAAGSTVYAAGYSEHIWKTGNTERMRITSTGSVGIGTSSPAEPLHVARLGGADATLPTFDANTAILTTPGGITTSSGSAITIHSNVSGNSAINFSDTDDIDIGRISYSHSADSMLINVNNSERMRIDSSGNVGIGTVSPAQKLDVNGTIKGTGFSTASTTNPISYMDQNVVWSPTFVSSGGGETISYTVNSGQYCRYGEWVTCTGRIVVASVSGGSGSVFIGGLPFTTVNSSIAQGTLQVGTAIGFVTTAPQTGGTLQNTVTCLLKYFSGSQATSFSWSEIQAGSTLFFTIIYRAA
jgi:hypothetical protein